MLEHQMIDPGYFKVVIIIISNMYQKLHVYFECCALVLYVHSGIDSNAIHFQCLRRKRQQFCTFCTMVFY
jgi:hypothetical protein